MKGDVDIMNNNNKFLLSFLLDIVALILVIISAFQPFMLNVRLNIIAIYMYFLRDAIIKCDLKRKKEM